ncbi:uncharacterized protein LOC124242450 isoform X2 [Equus quagga]|uniref:uncharacterized protein LOC124242450 isoform X2 n=1 Tax=Equus quagga TaxID=89248 RepID=UPI001EE1671D|nr:uncharacterized protein LOC124242450 isoform X2 [Equus quagga]
MYVTGQEGAEELRVWPELQDPEEKAGAWLACWGRGLTGSALPGREGKGPCPLSATPRRQESQSPGQPVWGRRETPESQAAGALGDTQTEPSLDQVLQERDEAIAKKRAVEAELDTCRAKLRAVEAQLLEVLEEKLRLRQEEDMQQLVRQRVESQLQRESRGTLGDPVDPGTARAPRVRFPLGRWGRWR